LDEVRRLVLDRSRELGIPMSTISLAIGRNHAYLHQYLKRGNPKFLPEQDRHRLAKVIGVSEELLRGRDLQHLQAIDTPRAKAQPNGKARAAVGRADLEDMWTIWNSATVEERQLIVDMAKLFVGRIRK
jgi:hypothetical protein